METYSQKKPIGFLAGAVTTALLLAGCASGGGQAGASAEGFNYNASQEEVNAAIEDLEPVTLTYQPAAQSNQSPTGEAAEQLKSVIEERSNGQITIDLVWGQAIAGYDEIDDALVDGRVDIAMTIPSYDPSVYPVHNAFAQATTGFPTSPIVGNAVTGAVLTELSYRDEIRSEFQEKGLEPLHAAFGTSTYYTYCPDPIESIEDWNGRQFRVGGEQHHTTIAALGASPTSMSAAETYDAIQRGTIDCEFGRITSNLDRGIAEIAPHMGYSDEESAFADLVFGSLVAGTNYQNLPLPYQQIVFDSLSEAMRGTFESTIESMSQTAEIIEQQGGGFLEYDDETKAVIREANESFRESTLEDGILEGEFLDDMDASIDRWTTIVSEELGYSDDGDLSDLNTWYEGDADWGPITERIQEEILMEHRPS